MKHDVNFMLQFEPVADIGDTLSFDGGHKPGETLKYKMLR